MEHLLDDTTSLELEHIDPYLMQQTEQERQLMQEQHQPHILSGGHLSGGLDALQHIPTSHDRTNGDSARAYTLPSPNLHPHSSVNGATVVPLSLSTNLVYDTSQMSWDGHNSHPPVRGAHYIRNYSLISFHSIVIRSENEQIQILETYSQNSGGSSRNASSSEMWRPEA